jgi:hypothetical protein
MIPGGSYSNAGSKPKNPRSQYSSIWVVGIRRVCRIGPGAVDHCRVIGRHIDHRGVGRFNDNRLPLDFNLLLLRCFQVALSLGLGAQLLDGVHDIRLLSQESITQVLSPVQLLAHHG